MFRCVIPMLRAFEPFLCVYTFSLCTVLVLITGPTTKKLFFSKQCMKFFFIITSGIVGIIKEGVLPEAGLVIRTKTVPIITCLVFILCHCVSRLMLQEHSTVTFQRAPTRSNHSRSRRNFSSWLSEFVLY